MYTNTQVVQYCFVKALFLKLATTSFLFCPERKVHALLIIPLLLFPSSSMELLDELEKMVMDGQATEENCTNAYMQRDKQMHMCGKLDSILVYTASP